MTPTGFPSTDNRLGKVNDEIMQSRTISRRLIRNDSVKQLLAKKKVALDKAEDRIFMNKYDPNSLTKYSTDCIDKENRLQSASSTSTTSSCKTSNIQERLVNASTDNHSSSSDEMEKISCTATTVENVCQICIDVACIHDASGSGEESCSGKESFSRKETCSGMQDFGGQVCTAPSSNEGVEKRLEISMNHPANSKNLSVNRVDSEIEGFKKHRTPFPSIEVDSELESFKKRLTPFPSIEVDSQIESIKKRLTPFPSIEVDSEMESLIKRLTPFPSIGVDSKNPSCNGGLKVSSNIEGLVRSQSFPKAKGKKSFERTKSVMESSKSTVLSSGDPSRFFNVMSKSIKNPDQYRNASKDAAICSTDNLTDRQNKCDTNSLSKSSTDSIDKENLLQSASSTELNSYTDEVRSKNSVESTEQNKRKSTASSTCSTEYKSCNHKVRRRNPVGLISSASTEFDSCVAEVKSKNCSESRSSAPLNAFNDEVGVKNSLKFNTRVERSPPKKVEFSSTELFPGGITNNASKSTENIPMNYLRNYKSPVEYFLLLKAEFG